MSTRSMNKVQLIGNLTRDPELKYTSQGTAIVTFGVATNRSWTNSDGDRNEEAEFHNIVAWAKLAEICDQLLFKGRKVYVEGRIQTREWTDDSGNSQEKKEIVAERMIVLDRRRKPGSSDDAEDEADDFDTEAGGWGDDGVESEEKKPKEDEKPQKKSKDEKKSEAKKKPKKKEKDKEESVNVDDIPF